VANHMARAESQSVNKQQVRQDGRYKKNSEKHILAISQYGTRCGDVMK